MRQENVLGLKLGSSDESCASLLLAADNLVQLRVKSFNIHLFTFFDQSVDESSKGKVKSSTVGHSRTLIRPFQVFHHLKLLIIIL